MLRHVLVTTIIVYTILTGVIFVLCDVVIHDINWCELDSGFTTLVDQHNEQHKVYLSIKPDGSIWLRVGLDRQSDWSYQTEYENKYQMTMFPTTTLNLLKTLNFTNYCVLSDLDLTIRMESAWQPSYVVVFNPGNRRSKLLRFPNEEDCSMQSNLTLSESKQEFLCNGGPSNRCGYKAIPELGEHSGTQFIKMVNFDPLGKGNWMCSSPQDKKSYTFYGSYYYGYVKLAECSPPIASRSIGYDVTQRTHVDDVTNVIMIPDPTQRLLSDVVLQGWQVYAKVTSIRHQIYLQIWRPLETANQYSLVTHTLFEPQKLRFNEVRVESDLLIHSGDVIGFYFRTHNPIPYSSVPCARSEQFVHVINRPAYRLNVGDTHTFSVMSNTRHLCRHYSINAILGTPDGAKRVETWQCPHNNVLSTSFINPIMSSGMERNTRNSSHSGVPGLLLRGHKTPLLAIHLIFSVLAALFLILALIAIVSYYQASRR